MTYTNSDVLAQTHMIGSRNHFSKLLCAVNNKQPIHSLETKKEGLVVSRMLKDKQSDLED